MSRRRILGEARRVYQARNGVARATIVDPEYPNRLVTHVQQDIEPILDSIKRDREIMPNTGENKLAARIPTVIFEELQRQGITEDEQLFKAWLNSSDAEPWRIYRGRL
jgi:hypothetical protein